MERQSLLPEGEKLRRAIRWISEMRLNAPEKKTNQLLQEAELKFDLTPKESMFLFNNLTQNK